MGGSGLSERGRDHDQDVGGGCGEPPFGAVLFRGILRSQNLGFEGNVDVLVTMAGNRHGGTSLIRITPPVGPYSSPLPRDLW